MAYPAQPAHAGAGGQLAAAARRLQAANNTLTKAPHPPGTVRRLEAVLFVLWHSGLRIVNGATCQLQPFYSPCTHGNLIAGYRCTTCNREVVA